MNSLTYSKFPSQTQLNPAPELSVQKWLNVDETLSLEKLRGKVVAIFAFQMRPSCLY